MNLDTETEKGRHNVAVLYDMTRALHLLDTSTINVEQAARRLGLDPLPDGLAETVRDSVVYMAERAMERHMKRIRIIPLDTDIGI